MFTQIDVFVNAEAKVASLAEVLGAQLVFLDLQPLLKDFHCLLSTNSAVNGNLFISANTETTDGQTGWATNSQQQKKKIV